jgi:hypothetical protein
MSDKNYKLIPANESWLRKILSPVVRLDVWWLTYRLPFQKLARITFPTSMDKSLAKKLWILKHEEVHADQFAKWWGPVVIPLLAVLLPLPVYYSGRWFIERDAYLVDIKAGHRSIKSSVDTLWNRYGYAWPKDLMTKWFEDNAW